MQTLIKTLTAERANVYTVTDGRRTNFCRCPITVEIYEISQKIPVLGKIGYEVKLQHSAELQCESTPKVDADFFNKVSRFEVVGDIQRTDGIFERFTFDNLNLVEFDLFAGTWVFDVVDRNIIKKLVNI